VKGTKKENNEDQRLEKLKLKLVSKMSDEQSHYQLKQCRRCQWSMEGKISEKGMF